MSPMRTPSRRHRTILALVGAGILLAACGSSDRTDAPAAGPVSLDGTWTGAATRIRGSENSCAASIPMVLTVTGTAVRGEVRSPRDRTVTTSRFDGTVDATGRIAARAWYGGAENIIQGQFEGRRFNGTVDSNYGCFSTLRLTRD